MVTTRSRTNKLATQSISSDPWEAAKKSKSSTVASQTIIFASLLLDLVAFTIILPLFPKLLQYYKKHDGSDGLYSYLENKVDYFQHLVGIRSKAFNEVLFGGFLGSLFSLLQFLTSPIIGAVSDVYGRKPVILLSLIGVAVSYYIWSISFTFLTFVISRIIGGICKGNLSLSMAAMTDVSTSDKRASGMALVGTAFSIGFVVGPLIGAYFSSGDVLPQFTLLWFAKPAYFALFLTVIDMIFVILAFNETLPKEKRMKSVATSLRQGISYINPKDLFMFAALKNITVKELQELRLLGLIYFLYLFLYSGLEFTITFLTDSKFGFTRMEQGYMLAASGIIMALLQGTLVRKLPPKSVQKLASRALLLIVPSFILVGLAEDVYLLYAGVVIYAISTAFAVPCLTTIASKYGSVSQKGTVIGIFRSLGYFARALGPIIASTAYWIVGPFSTYCAGGILLIVPWYCLQFTKTFKV